MVSHSQTMHRNNYSGLCRWPIASRFRALAIVTLACFVGGSEGVMMNQNNIAKSVMLERKENVLAQKQNQTMPDHPLETDVRFVPDVRRIYPERAVDMDDINLQLEEHKQEERKDAIISIPINQQRNANQAESANQVEILPSKRGTSKVKQALLGLLCLATFVTYPVSVVVQSVMQSSSTGAPVDQSTNDQAYKPDLDDPQQDPQQPMPEQDDTLGEQDEPEVPTEQVEEKQEEPLPEWLQCDAEQQNDSSCSVPVKNEEQLARDWELSVMKATENAFDLFEQTRDSAKQEPTLVAILDKAGVNWCHEEFNLKCDLVPEKARVIGVPVFEEDFVNKKMQNHSTRSTGVTSALLKLTKQSQGRVKAFNIDVEVGVDPHDGAGPHPRWLEALKESVQYAMDSHARVINVALTQKVHNVDDGDVVTRDAPTQAALVKLMQQAQAGGVVVVMSAGNTNTDLDAPRFDRHSCNGHRCYDHAELPLMSIAEQDLNHDKFPTTLVVTKTGGDTTRHHEGNYGATHVDLAVPGSGVSVADGDSNSGFAKTGTDASEYATAFASGAIALVIEAAPQLIAEEAVAIVRATTRPIETLYEEAGRSEPDYPDNYGTHRNCEQYWSTRSVTAGGLDVEASIRLAKALKDRQLSDEHFLDDFISLVKVYAELKGQVLRFDPAYTAAEGNVADLIATIGQLKTVYDVKANRSAVEGMLNQLGDKHAQATLVFQQLDAIRGKVVDNRKLW